MKSGQLLFDLLCRFDAFDLKLLRIRFILSDVYLLYVVPRQVFLFLVFFIPLSCINLTPTRTQNRTVTSVSVHTNLTCWLILGFNPLLKAKYTTYSIWLSTSIVQLRQRFRWSYHILHLSRGVNQVKKKLHVSLHRQFYHKPHGLLT